MIDSLRIAVVAACPFPLARGTPVSFDSSAPGMVHRRNCWLIPGSDHRAMAEGIVTLLTSELQAREPGAAARQYVAENCRWTIAAKRCEALYRTLIRARA